MKTLSGLALAVLLLSSALGRSVAPGEAFTLAFSGVEGALSWETGPFRPLLLPEVGEGLALVVLEAPPTLPPGVYPVCAWVKETTLCQPVEVKRIERLLLNIPPRAQGTLSVFLANRGNVPLRVSLASAPESQVYFPSQAVELEPGEEKAVTFPLRESGTLLLLIAYGDRKERYLVQVEGPGGSPPPYRLLGSLALGYPGLSGTLSLEGPLARDASLALKVEGGGMGLRGNLRLGLGPWGLSAGSGPTFGVSYAEGPWRLAMGYPMRLEGEWVSPGMEAFRLEVTPERFRFGYAALGLSVQGGCGFNPLCHAPSFRLERGGEPAYFLAWEGGLRLGGSLPGYSLEASPYPVPWLRGAHWGSLGEVGYRVEALLDPRGGRLSGNLSLPLTSGTRFSLTASLGGENALGVGLNGRMERMDLWLEGRLSSRLELGGTLRWEEGPYGLRLEARWAPEGSRLGLEGRYAFSLAVPPEVTWALGGYDRLPLEGEVHLLGKPLASAEVRAEGASVLTDSEGRFRIFLPRGGGRVRILPPPDALAFPLEVEVGPPPWVPLAVSLPPASRIHLACTGEGGKGAYVVGQVTAYVACGGQAVLPPGSYRLFPEASPEGEVAGLSPKEVALLPLEGTPLTLSFRLKPREVIGDVAFPIAVRFFPNRPAPGEEVRLEVSGAKGRLWLSTGEEVLSGDPKGDGTHTFTFQVPWEAKGTLSLRLRGELGFSRELLLPLDEGRELLEVTLTPPRASPGEEVKVTARVRFPAEGVFLRFGAPTPQMNPLPTGDALALAPIGDRVYEGEFVLDDALVRLAEPLGPSLAKGLRLEVVARQGDREVRKGLRLFLR
ncbi:hypothetical protein [Thermus albus]|uniref:hypothetical protein n=1 Tax=Thermus albus TaxID=2908146 RepID=UPI001FAAEA0F|nr:hypothetical protein [Thermus albus]